MRLQIRSARNLRVMIVSGGLSMIFFTLFACLALPAFGFFDPPEEDAWSLWQLTTPVVLGFIGTVAASLSTTESLADVKLPDLAPLVIVGLFAVYVFGNVGLVLAYYVDHFVILDDRGMSFEQFKTVYSGLLGIMAACFSYASALLFAKARA